MKITEKDKKEVTDKLIKKIVFRINTLTGKSSKFGVFNIKVESLFDYVFPDLEALSWISLDDFGELAKESIDVLFEHYRNDLRYMYDNNSAEIVVAYHEKIGDLYINKYREFENSNSECMMNIMKYFCMDHDDAIRIVAKEKIKGGCYIATMAYGDYNHSQVVKLRQFRDSVLMPSIIGQRFVSLYYKFSPKLVEKLKPFKLIHKLVRIILNAFMILFRLN
jgi:hypothetical protein